MKKIVANKMVRKGTRQVYKNFRLSYRKNWNITKRIYEENTLVIMISRRMFWYNFESIRRVIIRTVRKKIRKRYKMQKMQKIQKKNRNKTWGIYKRDRRYVKKLLWISGLEWLPLTMKSRGSRMGHGKGRFKIWYIRFCPGVMMLKIQCWKSIILYMILKRVSYYYRVIQFINIKKLIYRSKEELYW